MVTISVARITAFSDRASTGGGSPYFYRAGHLCCFRPANTSKAPKALLMLICSSFAKDSKVAVLHLLHLLHASYGTDAANAIPTSLTYPYNGVRCVRSRELDGEVASRRGLVTAKRQNNHRLCRARAATRRCVVDQRAVGRDRRRREGQVVEVGERRRAGSCRTDIGQRCAASRVARARNLVRNRVVGGGCVQCRRTGVQREIEGVPTRKKVVLTLKQFLLERRAHRL